MRKFLSFVAILALLVMAVVPAAAQDELPTIAEIVVASTELDTPEFTILLAAVAAADPVFLETLSNPEAVYTVFAPTDAAFGALLEALGLTAEEVLGNADLLNAVLAYHVVPGMFDAEAVVALDGSLLGTLMPEQGLVVTVGDMGVMVNESTVVAADVMASNGVVHVIDAVLVPVLPEADDMMATEEPMMEAMGSIADIVVASTEADAPEFTILLAAVAAADPMVLAELTNGGPFTVFAPTDAAFAAALEALGVTAEDLLADTELLTGVLAYHVVPGTFSAETVVAAASASEEGVLVATLAGLPLTITASDMGVMVNDATVVATDVMADNGIIHVIDAVLLPPM
jgi:transforming growth factor-beta-induced protein